MMPPPDHQNPVDMHTSIMCIDILQNIKAVGGDSRTNHVSIFERMNKVQLPVILRIFDENQNPVDMHISIMCINILQNIKAVAPKL
jgi:hypothetical protein